jgi:steroid delta-isomerase-like uncharacterized protein
MADNAQQTRDATLRVLERYWNAEEDDTSMFAPDVVYRMMATGEEHRGPEGIRQLLHDFYQRSFDAIAETRNVVVGDGIAVLEAEVVGTHTGEFAGVPATGKEVRIPLVVIYEVSDDLIRAGRVYVEIPVFHRQVGAS